MSHRRRGWHRSRSLFARATSGVVAACVMASSVGGCSRSTPTAATPLRVVSMFGEVGLSPGQFSYPRAMDTDGKDLWVIDKLARVQHLDGKTGAYLGGWKMPEMKFGKPTGVTVGPGDDGETLVYVADTHYHRVMVYRPGDAYEGRTPPTLVTSIGSFGEGPGQFTYPTDIAVLIEPGAERPARLYISEYGGNDRISVFEHDEAPNAYRFAFSFGSFGESTSAEHVQFKRPQSMQIDMRRRELVVTDACNHRVGRFTLEGKLIGWIGVETAAKASPGFGPAEGVKNLATPSTPEAPAALADSGTSPASTGEKPGAEGDAAPVHFNFPYGLCLLPDGSALVCEFGAGHVQWIDVEHGRSLGSFGVPGRGPGELASPWTATTIGARVYVLDSGNNRVQSFELPGRGGRIAMHPEQAGEGGRLR